MSKSCAELCSLKTQNQSKSTVWRTQYQMLRKWTRMVANPQSVIFALPWDLRIWTPTWTTTTSTWRIGRRKSPSCSRIGRRSTMGIRRRSTLRSMLFISRLWNRFLVFLIPIGILRRYRKWLRSLPKILWWSCQLSESQLLRLVFVRISLRCAESWKSLVEWLNIMTFRSCLELSKSERAIGKKSDRSDTISLHLSMNSIKLGP